MVKRLFKSERGDAAVLITVLFACLIGLTTVIFAATKASAGRSCADAAFRLAGRSILAEYDTRLYADYGLLAFRGDEQQIEKDLAFYADSAVKTDAAGYNRFLPLDGGSKMIHLRTEYGASLKQFSLLDVELFEAQLHHAVEKKIIAVSEDSGPGFGDTEGEPETARVLRNQAVKEALPSHGYVSSGALDLSDEKISLLAEVFDSAGAETAADEYIVSVFGYAHDGVYAEERFFAREVEYIIAGKESDAANYAVVKAYLTTLRDSMNKAALLADTEKCGIITALAAPFAAEGGAGELAAFEAITKAWVSAETRNDIMILEDGGRVPFFKNSAQWATLNIEEILNGAISSTAEYPADSGGALYGDYLKALLFLMEREEKLLRVMDLI
ncbi:MAG: DUF5702 domain-containing protein, partial [Clostridiales Family XIII bacterium]|nr:DUF5702 domain-containing protein [Clostridiales Family XIII bacterium]